MMEVMMMVKENMKRKWERGRLRKENKKKSERKK